VAVAVQADLRDGAGGVEQVVYLLEQVAGECVVGFDQVAGQDVLFEQELA